MATITLKWIRDLVWPNGKLITAQPSTDTDETRAQLRNYNRRKLLLLLPNIFENIGSKRVLPIIYLLLSI